MKTAVCVGMFSLMVVGEAAASPQWSVTPPPGWSDVSDVASQLPGVQKPRQHLTENGGTTELASYSGEQGEMFTVMFSRQPAGRSVARQARSFEAGLHDNLAKQGPDTNYTIRQEDNTLIADQVIADPGGTLRSRRMIGANGSEMLSLIGVCNGPAAVCVAALQSMTLNKTGFLPFEQADSVVDRSSDAYRQGQVVGNILLALIAVLALLLILRRIRNKQPSG